MTVKTANLGPTATSQLMATGAATLYNVHWVTATSGTGTVQFHDGTSTSGERKMTLDTPAAKNQGTGDSMSIGGGGLKFSSAIFLKKSNSGGVTITYATGN